MHNPKTYLKTFTNHSIMSLIDISDKRYYTTIQNLSTGSQFQIPVNKFAKGVYIVTIENDGIKEEVTIVKQ